MQCFFSLMLCKHIEHSILIHIVIQGIFLIYFLRNSIWLSKGVERENIVLDVILEEELLEEGVKEELVEGGVIEELVEGGVKEELVEGELVEEGVIEENH